MPIGAPVQVATVLPLELGAPSAMSVRAPPPSSAHSHSTCSVSCGWFGSSTEPTSWMSSPGRNDENGAGDAISAVGWFSASSTTTGIDATACSSVVSITVERDRVRPGRERRRELGVPGGVSARRILQREQVP